MPLAPRSHVALRTCAAPPSLARALQLRASAPWLLALAFRGPPEQTLPEPQARAQQFAQVLPIAADRLAREFHPGQSQSQQSWALRSQCQIRRGGQINRLGNRRGHKHHTGKDSYQNERRRTNDKDHCLGRSCLISTTSEHAKGAWRAKNRGTPEN